MTKFPVYLGCFVVGLIVAAPAGAESVYGLNGREIVFSGEQIVVFLEGIAGRVEATAVRATLTGEEGVKINGRLFRAYGKKVEVNGEAYPVGGDNALEIDDRGVHIHGAGEWEGSIAGKSVYSFNGNVFLLSGKQSIGIPRGIGCKIEAPRMTAGLTGEKEVTINGRTFRAYGQKVEINGKVYSVKGRDSLEVEEEGVLVFGGEISTGTGPRKSVFSLNGIRIVFTEEQTLAFPEGISGRIEATAIRATLAGEEKVKINRRKIRSYGRKVEVDGMAFPVGKEHVLEISNQRVIIRGGERAREAASGKSVYNINGNTIVLSGKQIVRIPKGISGNVRAPEMRANLTGEEEVTINFRRFQVREDQVLVDGEVHIFKAGQELRLGNEGITIR